MSSDLQLKDLTISDKDILTPYLLSNKYGICDFSFSNIFMWRHTYKVDYAIHKDFLVILSSTFDGERCFFMPLGAGDPTAVIADMIAWSRERGQDFRMLGLTPEMLAELGLGPDFAVEPAEVWDYIYNSEDLITLKGKKFHGKRNHINKFDSLYNYEYTALEPGSGHIPLCLELLDAWDADNAADPTIIAEDRAVREALGHFTELDLSGGCLFIDGRLCAFTMGQPLNRDIFVIHVEKALYEYEGIYAKINQLFAAHNCKDYPYINREEDMGVEGLRKSKMSYNPVRLLTKQAGILAYDR